MWSLLKFLIFLTLIAMFLWFGTHVKMGKYTLFGHVARIWNTEEAQDLVKGVREGSGPAVEKVKRGVKAGLDEATKPDADAGVAPAAPLLASAGHAAPAPAPATDGKADAGVQARPKRERGKVHKKHGSAGI